MNKHLKQLIELSTIDRTIDGFLPEEERINASLNALLQEQSDLRNEIEHQEMAIEENRHKISKNENHLAELSDKLAAFSKRSGDVKTEKEMKALQLEEEIAKEQVAFANEEIERLQRIEEAKKEEIETLKTRIGEIDSEVEETKKANAAALSDLDERKKSYYQQKEALVAEVPQKVLSFYEKIRRWAGNTAVVRLKKQACYGCYMKVSDKVYSEVIDSSEMVTCPNCGRILYYQPEEEEQATAA